MAEDPVKRLRSKLHDLYLLAGQPSSRSLKAWADRHGRGLSPSTVSAMLRGATMPRLSTLETLVEACLALRNGPALTDDLGDLDCWREWYGSAVAFVASRHAVLYVADSGRYALQRFPSVTDQRLPEGPPSRLLAVRNQVVDFFGRDEELDRLATWRDSDVSTAVLLLHGPGGQGKTRLANRFAQFSQVSGWLIAEARHVVDFREPIPAGTAALPDSDLLVIVDYADRWPALDLLELLADQHIRERGRRLRVLLLARTQQWWSTLRHEVDQRIAVDSVPLWALAGTQEQRLRVFELARDRFAQVLGANDAGLIPAPRHLDAAEFELVLAVHMAALVAVDAHVRSGTPPENPNGLSAYLLDREQAHWRRMFQNAQDGVSPRTLGRAVFIATLVGGTSYPVGKKLLDEFDVTSPKESAQDVLAAHGACYPPIDQAAVLTPLLPDRLGEDFLALLAPGHAVHGFDPDPWAAGVAERLVRAMADVERSPWTRRLVTTLVETAARWPHVVRRELSPLLMRHPDAVIVAGGQAIAALAALEDLDLAVLEAVEARIPDGRHVDLDVGVAVLTERLTTHRLMDTRDGSMRAELFHKLSRRLANAGRYQDALDAAEAAESAIRSWGSKNRVKALPELLATTIVDRASLLSNLGRINEAITAARAAVDAYSELADRQPTWYEPGLAMALNNLGAMLTGAGDLEEAVAICTRGVNIFRRIAHQQPASRPSLAAALDNLGGALAAVGRYEDAFTVTDESVGLLKQLDADEPTLYRPDLALATDNLSVLLLRLGRGDEALNASIEAVTMARQLAQANPAVFSAAMANAIANLGGMMAEAHRHAEAMALTAEAADIFEQLAAAHPTAFDADLARSLYEVARVHAETGVDLAAAANAVDRATRIYEELARDWPKAYMQQRESAQRLAADLHSRAAPLPEDLHRKTARKP